jgi:DNA-binding transcriptional ArsR family regulator
MRPDFSAHAPRRALDKDPCDKNPCDVDAIRDLSGDPAAMSALAHPVRLALLELLGRDGPLTATAAGERLGQSPGNMSWHLRILARHHFVVEADGGIGRRRPWKLTASGQRLDPEQGSPEERAAADALLSTVVERTFGQLRAWLAGRRAAPSSWQRAAAVSQWTLYLTSTETAQVRDTIYQVLAQFGDRVEDPSRRPDGAMPVNAFVSMHPQAFPPAEAQP